MPTLWHHLFKTMLNIIKYEYLETFYDLTSATFF